MLLWEDSMPDQVEEVVGRGLAEGVEVRVRIAGDQVRQRTERDVGHVERAANLSQEFRTQ